jgi:tetratricopeptide (TPR) repeat protein
MKNDFSLTNPIVGAHLLYVTAMNAANNGDFATAEDRFWKAHAIFVENWGEENPWAALLLYQIGQLQAADDRDAEAETTYRRALVIGEGISGAEHLIVTEGRGELAALLMKRGKWSEGIALMRKCLSVVEKLDGPSFPQLVPNMNGLARDVVELEEPARAEEILREHLRVVRKLCPNRNHELVNALRLMAHVYRGVGKSEAEITTYREVLDILRSLPDATAQDLAEARHDLATAEAVASEPGEIR